ncbi:hypothetical protein RJD38_20000 [Vibrio scophthalmi]|uniref:hypothetical protein n=1 Tax=Vibrio scophthalmi TaxID=45658 RepID=UPI00349FB995
MKSKMFMFFFVFMILSGCTYHKAMDEQSRRQAIIEKNMENEYKISNMQSKEKSNLEMEVTKLKRDLFALDAEIESINESMKQAIH